VIPQYDQYTAGRAAECQGSVSASSHECHAAPYANAVGIDMSAWRPSCRNAAARKCPSPRPFPDTNSVESSNRRTQRALRCALRTDSLRPESTGKELAGTIAHGTPFIRPRTTRSSPAPIPAPSRVWKKNSAKPARSNQFSKTCHRQQISIRSGSRGCGISMKLKDHRPSRCGSPKGGGVTLSSCCKPLRTISNEESEPASARLGGNRRSLDLKVREGLNHG
jgi:hypothetical protein